MHRAVGQPHGIALDLPAHRRVQVVEGGPGHDQVHRASAVDRARQGGCDLGFVADDRSEEHTSELQSLMRISYAVFCLKKKTQKNAIVLQHIPLYRWKTDTLWNDSALS